MDSSELFGSLKTDRRASIGLIGFGRWGQTIARSLDNNKNCKISALVSHHPVASDQIPKDCTVYSTSVEMYRKHSISAVIIANSPKDHYQEALLALESNLPTWIEKPLTANSEESLELDHYQSWKSQVDRIRNALLALLFFRKNYFQRWNWLRFLREI